MNSKLYFCLLLCERFLTLQAFLPLRTTAAVHLQSRQQQQQLRIAKEARTTSTSLFVKPQGDAEDKEEKPGTEKEKEDTGPEFLPDEIAKDFFANPFFYHNKPGINEAYKSEREEKFGDKTVYEVLNPAKDMEALNEATDATGLSVRRIIPYWTMTRATAEEQLDGRFLFPYGDRNYIELLQTSYNSDCSIFRPRHKEDWESKDERSRGIQIVLGSSGSGKTSFCVNELAQWSGDGKKHFTVYFSCKGDAENDSQFQDSLLNNTQNSIQAACFKGAYSRENPQLLEMDLTLILDEAYAARDKLKNLNQLASIRGIFQNLVSGTVRLVVAGTGYDEVSKEMDSRSEVLKYDMKPWNVSNAIKIAAKQPHAGYVKTCLERHSILAKLCTNARSATFLVAKENEDLFEKIAVLNDDAAVGNLLAAVVRKYKLNNGLRNLDIQGGRRVARGVFAALDFAQKNPDKQLTQEKYKSIRDDEYSNALSLIDQNYEIVKGGAQEINLLDESMPPITITPALTFVLYDLLGVTIDILAGWQGMEVIGALTVMRHLVVHELNDEELAGTRLVQLQRQVPAGRATKNVSVPKQPEKGYVFLNGKAAPFADFFAYGYLGQTKYTSNPNQNVTVDMFEEFEKMGLLKEDKVPEKRTRHDTGAATLRALQCEWESAPCDSQTTALPNSDLSLTSSSNQGAMIVEQKKYGAMYPDEQLIRKDEEKIKFKEYPILQETTEENVLKPMKWTVCIATNGRRLCLKLGEASITIERQDREKYIDSDGIAKSDSEVDKWLKENVCDYPDRITVKFLFAIQFDK